MENVLGYFGEQFWIYKTHTHTHKTYSRKQIAKWINEMK